MTSTTKPQFDARKFRELILYVASRLAGDPSNGSIKMNKVLFFSDFLHYARYGSAITGAEYAKHPLGPAPRGIRRVEQELIANAEADMAVVWSNASTQKMLFAKRPADLSLFSGSEIAQVEAVIETLSGRTAMEASEISHLWRGWQVAQDKETIPYAAAFLFNGPVTEDDILLAKHVANNLRPELERAGVSVSAA